MAEAAFHFHLKTLVGTDGLSTLATDDAARRGRFGLMNADIGAGAVLSIAGP
jgi:hypothetical protein